MSGAMLRRGDEAWDAAAYGNSCVIVWLPFFSSVAAPCWSRRLECTGLEQFPYYCKLPEFNQAQLFLTEKLR
jgi:hypothetical protein